MCLLAFYSFVLFVVVLPERRTVMSRKQQELCRDYLKGTCDRGAKCKYVHDDMVRAQQQQQRFYQRQPAYPVQSRYPSDAVPMHPPYYVPYQPFYLPYSAPVPAMPFQDAVSYYPYEVPQYGAPYQEDFSDTNEIDTLDEEEEQLVNEWYPAHRDCGCCKGYIYGCKDSTCQQLGVCGCAAADSS